MVAIANIYYGCIHMVDLGAWPWACYTAVLAVIVGISLAKDASDWLRCVRSMRAPPQRASACFGAMCKASLRCKEAGQLVAVQCRRPATLSPGRCSALGGLRQWPAHRAIDPLISSPPPPVHLPAHLRRARNRSPGTPKSARVLLPSPVKSHDVESGTNAAINGTGPALDGMSQPHGWKDSPASSEH